MRVINTTTFSLHNHSPNDGYAILSHRWVGEEITLQQYPDHIWELRSGVNPLSTPQIEKIRGACEVARQLGYQWLWVDSCCINKESSSELQEAINSMFMWYRSAKVCIAYLNDVERTQVSLDAAAGASQCSPFQSTERDAPSFWFSRGWTLQELLAPQEVLFFAGDWSHIATKSGTTEALQTITGIEKGYLTGKKRLSQACIATKMSWMADRVTTKEEDIAYCMLGIFNITMPAIYGEGMRAFTRLQEHLMKKSSDETLFAWLMPDPNAGSMLNLDTFGMQLGPGEWGLLAPSPAWFANSSHLSLVSDKQERIRGGTVALVPHGLEVPAQVLTMRDEWKACGVHMLLTFSFFGILWREECPKWFLRKALKREIVAVLNCWQREDTGEAARVVLRLRRVAPGIYARINCVGPLESGKLSSYTKGRRALEVLQPEAGNV